MSLWAISRVIDGRLDKRPLGRGMVPLAVNRTDGWLTRDAAKMLARNVDGGMIGVLLQRGEGRTVIDIDAPKDGITKVGDDSEFGRLSRAIVNSIGSYTEWSSSGRGVHIVVDGEIGQGRRVALPGGGMLEVYSESRYMIMTGNRLHERLGKIKPGLGWVGVINQYMPDLVAVERMDADVLDGEELPTPDLSEPARVAVPRAPGRSRYNPLPRVGKDTEQDDMDVISAVRSMHHGEQLCNGEWQSLYDSHSEADAALMQLICSATADVQQAARVWLRLPLSARPKGKRADYVWRTIMLVRGSLDDAPAIDIKIPDTTTTQQSTQAQSTQQSTQAQSTQQSTQAPAHQAGSIDADDAYNNPQDYYMYNGEMLHISNIPDKMSMTIPTPAEYLCATLRPMPAWFVRLRHADHEDVDIDDDGSVNTAYSTTPTGHAAPEVAPRVETAPIEHAAPEVANIADAHDTWPACDLTQWRRAPGLLGQHSDAYGQRITAPHDYAASTLVTIASGLLSGEYKSIAGDHYGHTLHTLIVGQPGAGKSVVDMCLSPVAHAGADKVATVATLGGRVSLAKLRAEIQAGVIRMSEIGREFARMAGDGAGDHGNTFTGLQQIVQMFDRGHYSAPEVSLTQGGPTIQSGHLQSTIMDCQPVYLSCLLTSDAGASGLLSRINIVIGGEDSVMCSGEGDYNAAQAHVADMLRGGEVAPVAPALANDGTKSFLSYFANKCKAVASAARKANRNTEADYMTRAGARAERLAQAAAVYNNRNCPVIDIDVAQWAASMVWRQYLSIKDMLLRADMSAEYIAIDVIESGIKSTLEAMATPDGKAVGQLECDPAQGIVSAPVLRRIIECNRHLIPASIGPTVISRLLGVMQRDYDTLRKINTPDGAFWRLIK